MDRDFGWYWTKHADEPDTAARWRFWVADDGWWSEGRTQRPEDPDPTLLPEPRAGNLIVLEPPLRQAVSRGLRYNEGKPPLGLVPLNVVANVEYRDRPPRPPAVALPGEALDALSAFQQRINSMGGTPPLVLGLLCLGKPWEGVARVFARGAEKYPLWNWQKGLSWTDCISSCARHLLAAIRGEELDPESGLPHVDHAACNLVMLAWMVDHYPEGDDRAP